MIDFYTEDIDMMADFIKLAALFDNAGMQNDDRKEILDIQKSILDLLSMSQIDKTSITYNAILAIRRKQEEALELNSNSSSYLESIDANDQTGNYITNQTQRRVGDKRDDHFIVLFFRSSCPACQAMAGDWESFKRANARANFTCIEYDGDDFANRKIFTYFNINTVPTVIKLTLDKQKFIERLSSPPTYKYITQFANF